MWQLHVEHGGQRGAEHRDELGRVGTVMRVHKVHGCQLREVGDMLEELVKTQRTTLRQTCSYFIRIVAQVSISHFRLSP